VKEAAQEAGRQAAKVALPSGQGIGRAKVAWRRAAALYIGLRFSDLRHQAITELPETGAQDSVIQVIAGHLSKRMLDHYSHVRRAAKRLAKTGGRPDESLAGDRKGIGGAPVGKTRRVKACRPDRLPTIVFWRLNWCSSNQPSKVQFPPGRNSGFVAISVTADSALG
jgi:hypothetical protein